MEIDFTHHALIRCQQRDIPVVVTEWLLRCGSVAHDKRGAVIHFFDRKSLRRLRKAVAPELLKRHEGKLSAYLVKRIGDDVVITVGKRYENKRIYRH